VLLAAHDDDYWGGDRDLPEPRTSYQINSTNPGTDVAAGAAAAFAACSVLYRDKGFNGTLSGPAALTNATYADVLLTHAKSLYSLALNANGGRKAYQKSVPVISQSYGSSGYGDELSIAALFLAWATDSQDLHDQAVAHWTKYQVDSESRVFNWDSKGSGIPILFTQVLRSSGSVAGNLPTGKTKPRITWMKLSRIGVRGGLLEVWPSISCLSVCYLKSEQTDCCTTTVTLMKRA